MPGRKRTPKALNELHGDPRKAKRDTRGDIKAALALPKAKNPNWGTKKEKELFLKYWKELAEQLYCMRILTELDSMAFEMLVTAYTKWQLAEQQATFQFDDGLMSPSHYANLHRIANQYQAQLYRLLQEFGMTPSARMKIKLPHDEGDEFDKFLQATSVAINKKKEKK